MPMYPAAISTVEDLLVAQNNWTTRTVLPVGIRDTEILLERAEGLQASNGLLSLDDEVISYTSISTNGTYPLLLGCVRGYDDTAAAAHERWAPVEDRWVAAHNNRLVDAVKEITAALGDDPAYDPATGYRHVSVAARLDYSLPLLLTMPLLSTWTAVHGRRRIVAVSLFKETSKGLVPFQAPMQQNVSLTGASSVTVTLTTPLAGYMLVQ